MILQLMRKNWNRKKRRYKINGTVKYIKDVRIKITHKQKQMPIMIKIIMIRMILIMILRMMLIMIMIKMMPIMVIKVQKLRVREEKNMFAKIEKRKKGDWKTSDKSINQMVYKKESYQ